MNELSNAQRLRGKNVVIIGGSRGLGKTIVAATHAEGAQVLAVARREQSLRQLAAEIPGVRVLALDAADEGAPAQVFETLLPDILVVCAGAIPHMAPLVEQSWEQFSRNWNSDVKMSLLFSQAALTTPLPAGTTIMLLSRHFTCRFYQQDESKGDNRRCSQCRCNACERLARESRKDVPGFGIWD
jgi:NAD(P)-dependent dehydrogenase (short-subunit alcohol dehydrogenase family)